MIDAPAVTLGKYRSPEGRAVSMYVRDETADHNNVFSCLDEDEYDLAELSFEDGDVLLDVGAHIGGVSIGLAVDNKQATVLAVEALSANVELLTRNVEANDAHNVIVLHAAAAKAGKKTADVEWNFGSGTSADHHRFIGNAQGMSREGAQTEQVKALSLADIVKEYGPIAFAKIDCERCEYDFLSSPAVGDVKEWRGEYHAGIERIVELLGDTHDVTAEGGESLGSFKAVRK